MDQDLHKVIYENKDYHINGKPASRYDICDEAKAEFDRIYASASEAEREELNKLPDFSQKHVKFMALQATRFLRRRGYQIGCMYELKNK